LKALEPIAPVLSEDTFKRVNPALRNIAIDKKGVSTIKFSKDMEFPESW
jgi:hypothetical protein